MANEFWCTRCEENRKGEPAQVGPASRICAECVAREKERKRQSSRRCRERQRARLKKERGKEPPGGFVCTRCGRPTYGSPALEGSRSKVCQLCVNAERQRQRKASRECAARRRKVEREKRGEKGDRRVCEKCGTEQFIYLFRKVGRGRSRWCMQCEDRFERYSDASRRKQEGARDSGDMAAEMAQRNIETLKQKRKKGGACDE